MKKMHRKFVCLIAIVIAVFAITCIPYTFSPGHFNALRRLNEVKTNPKRTRALRLHVTTLRPNVHAFDQTEFNVFVVLTFQGNEVKFSAKASFHDTNITHTYILVDKHGVYIQSIDDGSKKIIQVSSCLPKGSIPDIEDLLQLLRNTLPVSTVRSTSGQFFFCPENTKKLKVQSNGEDFVLCMTSEVPNGFRLLGAEINIDIHYLTELISIKFPSMKHEMIAKKCDQILTTSYVKDTNLYGLFMGMNLSAWFENTFDQGPMPPQKIWFEHNTTCFCKGKKRPCIFFHGVGNKKDRGLIDRNPSFGNIHQHAPCCSSIHFSSLNTIDFGWTNETLQKRMCQVATSVSNTSTTKIIKDTILVTHSMSNLMLAGAIANNSCLLDPSTSWVSISGPMRGSMGSDFQQNLCHGDTNVTANVRKEIGTLFGQCPVSPAYKELVYVGDGNTSTGTHASKSLIEKYAIARRIHRKYASAVICGTSFVGLLSIDAPLFVLGGTVVPHKSRQNDGIVEFESCRGDFEAKLFKSTFNTTYYRATLNHFDTQFRHGDGFFGLDKKPLKWFECLL